jgi:hypothetical protein
MLDDGASCANEVARLKNMLSRPTMVTKADILRRRIFAIEHGVSYGNPFNPVDECLYDIYKGSLPVEAQDTPYDRI